MANLLDKILPCIEVANNEKMQKHTRKLLDQPLLLVKLSQTPSTRT